MKFLCGKIQLPSSEWKIVRLNTLSKLNSDIFNALTLSGLEVDHVFKYSELAFTQTLFKSTIYLSDPISNRMIQKTSDS